jgi:hypothetical protein
MHPNGKPIHGNHGRVRLRQQSSNERPALLQVGQQSPIGAVPQHQVDDYGRWPMHQPTINEVLILGDDGPARLLRPGPDGSIGGSGITHDATDMLGEHAAPSQPCRD